MIRAASPGDLAALAELERAVFGQQGWSAAQLSAPLGDPDSLVLCVGEGPPTGLAILRIVADEVELLRIGVAPSARRAGVGRALLEQGLAWAGRRHAAQVHLEVERDNVAARALYARLGFREVGMRRGYFGPGRDALLFTLELGADR